jgi:hypothetical protein
MVQKLLNIKQFYNSKFNKIKTIYLGKLRYTFGVFSKVLNGYNFMEVL